MLQLVEQDRNYYEIIGNNPIKPYFDIDVKFGEPGYDDFNIQYYLDQLIHYFGQVTGCSIDKKDCVIINSSNRSFP